MNLAKLVSIGIALFLIQACSHPIEIEGFGDVTSTSTKGCTYEESILAEPPERCAKNYVVVAYDETYTATPRAAGWYFDHWVNYCTTPTAPINECSFNATAAQVKAFWFQTVPPLKAVFVTQCGDTIVAGIEQCDDGNVSDGDGCTATCTIPPDTDGDGVPDVTDNCPAVTNANQANFNNDAEGDACDDTDSDGILDISDGCPLNPTNPCALITSNDIVTAGGRQWAQPDLFRSISWDTINSICPTPGGVCGSSAVLNGYDMSGWTWASIDDVNGLFNAYIVPASIGPGAGTYDAANSAGAAQFFTVPPGFRPTLTDASQSQIYAWMRDQFFNPIFGWYGRLAWARNSISIGAADTFSTDLGALKATSNLGTGGFFYK